MSIVFKNQARLMLCNQLLSLF